MKKLMSATALTLLATSGAWAQEEIKLGLIIGFTGPIETLTPSMAEAAQAAVDEVNAAGTLLGGSTVTLLRADSTCIDAGVAVAAAENLITAEGVKGIVGADCSGVTGAVLQNVAIPNGILMISPSATSPALSTVETNGLFFRTAPSDAREGQIAAEIMVDRGITSFAMTYTNNDYGKGLADAIKSASEAAGITVTLMAAHEDGKADYSAEVGSLASAGGDILVVAGYLDQGGLGIIRAALDTGAFDRFVLPGGMIGDSLPQNVGPDLNGSFGQVAGSDAPGMDTLQSMGGGAFDVNSPYTAESYDAAALIMLAMQAAGSTDSQVYKEFILDVANGPGEEIYPGELAKAIEILQGGGQIDYVGATGVELVNGREAGGRYREIEVQDGANVTVRFR
jgi:branched-chain amino acid transport system substrate-binding protein